MKVFRVRLLVGCAYFSFSCGFVVDISLVYRY